LKMEICKLKFLLKKSKDFVRKGADLIYKMEINLLQALTGVSFVITHLDGKKILIKSNKLIKLKSL